MTRLMLGPNQPPHFCVTQLHGDRLSDADIKWLRSQPQVTGLGIGEVSITVYVDVTESCDVVKQAIESRIGST